RWYLIWGEVEREVKSALESRLIHDVPFKSSRQGAHELGQRRTSPSEVSRSSKHADGRAFSCTRWGRRWWRSRGTRIIAGREAGGRGAFRTVQRLPKLRSQLSITAGHHKRKHRHLFDFQVGCQLERSSSRERSMRKASGIGSSGLTESRGKSPSAL